MEFELSKSQKEIQKAARAFAKGEFDKEEILELAKRRKYPENVLIKAAELGFVGIHYPQSCEGGDMGMLEHVIVAEQFCRQDSAMGMAVLFAGFAAECIFRFGEENLAQKLVPPVVNGRSRSACAFFETHMVGALESVSTTVCEDNGGLVISGEKHFVLNGLDADFYVVLCKKEGKSENDASDKDLSLVVVESGRKGIDLTDAGKTIGNGLVAFGHVKFDNVRVPVENRLGKKGSGSDPAGAFMNEARIQIASMALGTAQGALERALAYIKQREQFGRKLSHFQIVRHKIAEMSVFVEQARWLVYKTAWAFDRKKGNAADAAIAKLTAARCAMAVTDEAVQLLGGYGYMAEYEVEHFYRDAKTIEIFMGSGLALKDAIADGVIGKQKGS